LAKVLISVSVVATVSLEAAASLEEVAHLRLVNTFCDSQLSLTMREDAVFTVHAHALLRPDLAKLRLLQIRLMAELRGRMGVTTHWACAFPTLEEVAHLRF
jgi:hypothetical protein